jgi:GT2 family glycosyltransferase
LARALASLAASEVPVEQIVVSDDGDPPSDAVAAMCTRSPNITYTQGPRRGLCANRNHALARANGDAVLFLDDDAAIASDFFTRILRVRGAAADPARLIVTGSELRDGHLILPHEQSFLGFQDVPYRGHDCVRTIVMNATVFPRALFHNVQFDERLTYGYDEVDLATRAVASGFEIAIVEDAQVEHFPSAVHRQDQDANVDAARLYVTTKRYAVTQRNPRKAIAYFVVAAAHMLISGARRGGLPGLRAALHSVAASASLLRALRREATAT